MVRRPEKCVPISSGQSHSASPSKSSEVARGVFERGFAWPRHGEEEGWRVLTVGVCDGTATWDLEKSGSAMGCEDSIGTHAGSDMV